MSTLKILLLLAVAFGTHATMTPPNPPSSPSERLAPRGIERMLGIWVDHHLITTGPYAVVRHPSYSGALLAGTGAVLCTLAPGAWAVECADVLGPLGLAVLWVVGFSIAGIGLRTRMRKEDEMLKGRFGKEWKEWAARVPYRIVPGCSNPSSWSRDIETDHRRPPFASRPYRLEPRHPSRGYHLPKLAKGAAGPVRRKRATLENRTHSGAVVVPVSFTQHLLSLGFAMDSYDGRL
ncbi:Protein-S-isoprenylcysteine O-methyltransferase [Mycena sanguinolenta]|uniref:Protein-S-isoprenylcysteine O-methyltransferase n=1 Tax=Mycena sanguinolenta TaxID=230812 RepID=A0A8H6Y2R1_9AGAR|nr:Protein-S-isoprenylcysteine O-methyltransferase [Mycena sanguinolenta]